METNISQISNTSEKIQSKSQDNLIALNIFLAELDIQPEDIFNAFIINKKICIKDWRRKMAFTCQVSKVGLFLMNI